MVLLRFNLTLVYCYGIKSALCPPPPPSTNRLAEPSPLTGASCEVTQPRRSRGRPGALPPRSAAIQSPRPAADSALRHFSKP